MKTATCIVGLVNKGIVYMGGDSAGVSGYDITTRVDTKVFIKETGSEKMLIGYTSSFRMGQLLRFSFLAPKRPTGMDVYEYMATDFINYVRHSFKEGGFAANKEGVESGGTFLVGYCGRLFTIHNDYQVGENVYGYDACGCGKDYAMSSLYSTNGLIKNPEKRLKIALSSAEEFSGGVKGPFNIRVLK